MVYRRPFSGWRTVLTEMLLLMLEEEAEVFMRPRYFVPLTFLRDEAGESGSTTVRWPQGRLNGHHIVPIFGVISILESAVVVHHRDKHVAVLDPG